MKPVFQFQPKALGDRNVILYRWSDFPRVHELFPGVDIRLLAKGIFPAIITEYVVSEVPEDDRAAVTALLGTPAIFCDIDLVASVTFRTYRILGIGATAWLDFMESSLLPFETATDSHLTPAILRGIDHHTLKNKKIKPRHIRVALFSIQWVSNHRLAAFGGLRFPKFKSYLRTIEQMRKNPALRERRQDLKVLERKSA